MASGLAGAASPAPSDVCGDATPIVLRDGRVLCTHGADRSPARLAAADGDGGDVAAGGPDTDSPYGDVPAGPLPTAPVRCYDDGTAGPRVQVVTVHAEGATSAATVDQVRRWVGQVEWTFAQSAARDGAERHVRWATEADPAGGCRATIGDVALPPATLADFASSVQAMADAGFDRNDRKYLMITTASANICGIGTAPNDDRASADNRANVTVGYARVDTECWDTGDNGFYAVAAHELAHTLGGVQTSAPHATPDRHCTDEWDLLCYDADGAGPITVTTVCHDARADTAGEGDLNNRLLDCNGDDYFNAAAPSGYLAGHWNVAGSVFLARTPDTGPGYAAHPDVTPDPRGRPMVWSGRLGVHRPLLRDAFGWEACDLPIPVIITEPGSVTGEVTAQSGLRDAVATAVDWVNHAAGTTVVTLDPSADPTGDHVAVITPGPVDATVGTPTPTRIAVTVTDARITAARVTIDSDRADDQLEVWTRQALIQALGIGRNGLTGDLMSAWPTTTVDTAGTAAALAHLYGDGACAQDRRLDDTVAGDTSQRRDGGSRSRLDLAAGATTPIDVALATAGWLRSHNGDHWATTAVVCRDDVHADCLAGSALAATDGPVLFVPGGPDGSLPDRVAAELTTALAADATVYVLGGTAAVSATIEAQLRQTSGVGQVIRVAGPDRYATAVAVADQTIARRDDPARQAAGSEPLTTTGPAPVALVARGDDPVDAVAAGAFAAAARVPVVLAAPTVLPGDTGRWLSRHPGTAILVGGTTALSDGVMAAARYATGNSLRIAGPDRFATSVALARHPALWARTRTGPDAGAVIGVNGSHPQTWALVLAATTIAARLHAPILYTTADTIPPVVAGQLTDQPMTGAADLTTITVAATPPYGDATLARTWHATAAPGFDGNLTVTRP